MNQPETQERIQAVLNNYLRSYLDSTPESGELSRVKDVLSMLTKYFERELRLSGQGVEFDLERSSIAEEVLRTLAPMMKRIRTDEELEAENAEIRRAPPPSPEQIE